MAPFVIAVDGPAASGKGTLARRLAAHYGFAHLDTGRLYRATALLVLTARADPADPQAAEAAARRVEAALLDDPRLGEERVGRAASVVAAIPQVRAALFAFQRAFAAAPPPLAKGAVLDGRDIGSVVCPDADVKLFLTATPEVRARRRVEELRGRGAPAIYETVLQDLKERDARDTQRRTAPLSAAADAIVIDTTALDADSVFETVLARIAPILARPD
ncbi:MAG TPA: (d)CMP kinase [Stellaceae bacterium]|nr:(d)CMP kinase [Stellaceae bacterium]